MSGRRTKRLGESNSAQLHQLLADILAIMDSIQLQVNRLGDGATFARWTVHQLVAYGAAETNDVATWSGHMPKGWTAMVDPTLVIFISSAAADTWTMTVQVDSAGSGESSNTSNLLNDAAVTATTAGATTFLKKELPLTGTISPEDIVSVEITKTSNDAQIMYITTAIWIVR